MTFGPRQLLLGLLVSVSVGNSIIFFAETENRAIYSELITILAACSAVLLATAIAFRQNTSAPHGKTYISLAIGLVLWLSADIIWATYELYFHVAAPIPSLSDFLWLSGYPFFAYNLFHTYKEFRKQISKRILVASIIGNAIFLGYLIPLTVNLSDFSSQAGIAMFAIIIAYPISNAILTIPAFPIFMGLWKDRPWSIPWTFKALSLVCIVVTDSWFAFIVITGLQEQVWLSSMLFGAEYLIMAGGLIWYNKFLARYSTNSNETESALSETRAKMSTTEISAATSRTRKYPIDIIAAIILIAVVIAYGTFISKSTVATEIVMPEEGEATIRIGALLPLTGTLSSFGESADASLRIGLEDINNYFSRSGSETRVELVIEDTKTDPSIALEKLKILESRGIRMVIGPATSASVEAVKEYADQHGIMILSVSSTAPQLAIPDDNVFRLVPDDSNQAEAIARRMWQDGVRIIVPMWRGDVFGEGLHSALEENFEQLGGKVVNGLNYRPPTADFAASLHRINFIFWEQDLKVLDSMVGEEVRQYGADKVGVYVVSFDEIVPLMIQAERHPTLSSVRWYGSDGSAQNADLVRNVGAASFAVQTSFINPIYSIEENEKFNALKERITQEVGPHRSYAESAYDALWVMVLSHDKVSIQADPDALRKALIETANSYDGVTGRTSLNDAGDRIGDSYEFWSITKKEDTIEYEWKSFENSYNAGSLTN